MINEVSSDLKPALNRAIYLCVSGSLIYLSIDKNCQDTQVKYYFLLHILSISLKQALIKYDET